jgi:hypothetical protein
MDIIGEGEIMTETKETAIVKRQEDHLLANPRDMRTLAQDLVNSQMFPNAKNIPGVIAIIQAGFELGIPPVAALNTMSVINGRLALEAKALLAIAQKKVGVSWKVLKEDDSGCEMEFSRPGFSPINVTFTEKEAKEAGLLGKQNWKTYKRDMYFARCASRGVRRIAPDAVLGMYSREEMLDVPQDNAGRGIATPTGEPEKTQPSASQAVKTATPQPDTAFFGGEDHPEAVVEGELLDDDGKEAPVDDGFFGGEKGGAVEGASVEPSEDLLFTDDAIAGIVSAIKDALKVEGVDEKAFKAWLAEVGPKKNPPRKYVGLKFGHQSLSAGNVNDLKRLHGEIHAAIKTFKRGAK